MKYCSPDGKRHSFFTVRAIKNKENSGGETGKQEQPRNMENENRRLVPIGSWSHADEQGLSPVSLFCPAAWYV